MLSHVRRFSQRRWPEAVAAFRAITAPFSNLFDNNNPPDRLFEEDPLTGLRAFAEAFAKEIAELKKHIESVESKLYVHLWQWNAVMDSHPEIKAVFDQPKVAAEMQVLLDGVRLVQDDARKVQLTATEHHHLAVFRAAKQEFLAR